MSHRTLTILGALCQRGKLTAFPEKVGVFEVDLTSTQQATEEFVTCTAGLAG